MHARLRFLASSAAVLTSLVAGRPLEGDVVIPSSAFSGGQLGAEFHSDVRVFNPTTAPVIVTPIFYNQATGQTVAAPAPGTVTVPARGQVAFDNILATLFLQAKGAFGPIRFQTPAPIVVSSGVNNVNACGNASTSGQWLPGIDVGQALKIGTLVQLAASADGGTGYHANVVFMNPGTATANVTTNLRNGDGTLVAAFTFDPLPANGFKQINSLSAWLPSPNTITDTNLWMEFTSDQPVLAFASVINNGSGDPFAIVMVAEPSAAPASATSYTVSANPAPGQPVTFTDTSTNSPVSRFWVFGDGTFNESGPGVVQHTYGAAGTYKSALFVFTAGGSGSAASDVVVASSAPTVVSIVATTSGATKWTYVPNNVTLKVGQPYVITWTTPLAEATVHGMGGLAVLGILDCDAISAQSPCLRNFTPTASQVGSHSYACTQTSCGTVGQHTGMTATITIAP